MKEDNIVELNQYREDKAEKEEAWLYDEVMCLCGYRWIAVHNERTWLKKFECPKCLEVGKVFKTGQNLTEET
jgi:hypothetical protein